MKSKHELEAILEVARRERWISPENAVLLVAAGLAHYREPYVEPPLEDPHGIRAEADRRHREISSYFASRRHGQ